MNYFRSRLLTYETNQNPPDIQYAEIIAIINDKMVNVNVGGEKYSDGSLVILEAVQIAGDYVPKIGDWVALEWRNGMPFAVGNNDTMSSGLTNINNNVKIISTNDLTNNVIINNHIQDQAITASKIQVGTITADRISANTITGDKIAANTISGNNIAAGTISGGNLEAGTITAIYIAAGTITGDKIAANTITGDRIAANTISGNNILANTIQSSNIMAGTIQGDRIADSTITGDRIAGNTITGLNISGNTITGYNISGNTISGNNIAANTITGANIAANTISGGNIQAGTLTATEIAAGSITGDKIAANTISGNNIASDTITGQLIAASTITSTNIQAGTITGDKIAANTISGNNIASNTITGQNISGQTISGNNIAANTISGGSLQIGTVTGDRIAANTINGNNIAANTISGNQLIIGTITGDRIAANTISGGSLEVGTLTGDRIAANTISGGSLEAGTITGDKIAAQTISGGNIQAGTITANQMQTGTITATSGIIASAAIQTANIADAAITSAKIGNGSVQTANIATGNITTALIADAAITNAKISSLDASKITTGYLSSAVISGGTIVGSQIAANTITGTNIKFGTISGGNILAGSITGDLIAGDTITGTNIAAGSITGQNIQSNSITSDLITTKGLDANIIDVYNSKTGQILIGGGYIVADGMDVGVVQSDNLAGNGVFMQASSQYGFYRSNPTGSAILGNQVSVQGENEVWQIDLTSGNVVRTYSISKPAFVGIHPSGNYAYVTSQGDGTLNQIDLVNQVVTSTKLTLGEEPAMIRWVGQTLGDDKHFFVLNRDQDLKVLPDSLSVIDTPPDSVNSELYVHHKIPLGQMPYDVRTRESNKMTYITLAETGDVAVLDTSSFDSHTWRVTGKIPLAAYATDNYHGGLDDGMFGLTDVTGGDSASQYEDASLSSASATTSTNAYGIPQGQLKKYTPHGIELSTDEDTIYVCDFENGEVVVLDVNGYAPYNALTGRHDSSTGPGTSRVDGDTSGGGPITPYVRYRIPVGETPDYIQLVSGNLYVSLQGSSKLAIINEQDIINAINADRQYYGTAYGDGNFSNWNVFQPMNPLPTFTVNYMNVGSEGSEPAFMQVDKNGYLYVVLQSQNQIAKIDTSSNTVLTYFNTGSGPSGIDFTPDGKYMFVTNFGEASTDLSFFYPQGPFIGDPFVGVDGGIDYLGASFWSPNRSDWVYDSSGNVQSYSTIEFHINEPFLDEGGYVKFDMVGIDSQWAKIEQDIYNATNYSNGNNVVSANAERLVADSNNNYSSGNTVFYPKEGEWQSSPVPNNFYVYQMDASGNVTSGNVASGNYTLTYGTNSNVSFSGGVVPSGGWVTANYTVRDNIWFKTQNGSILAAIDNSSSPSPNFDVNFEIDEFVPKFVVVDNQQTSNFTPTADGINDTYEGIEYSLTTNRALNIPSGSIVVYNGDSSVYASGTSSLSYIVDGSISGNTYSGGTGLQYVDLDLGSTYMIGQVGVWHYWQDGRTYSGNKTQISQDGSTWTTIWDSAVSGNYAEASGGHIISFNAVPTRYVRDWISGNSVDNYNAWKEIKAFGDWEYNTNYVYASGTPNAGQQIATNGKGIVTTDIPNAFLALNIAIEYSTWWYVSYVTGPEFGTMKISMPTIPNKDNTVQLNFPYVNKTAHRHTNYCFPSVNISADANNGIEAGKQRILVEQVSGKISFDRFRFEDFQYYKTNSLNISNDITDFFKQYKVVCQQAQWYQGVGTQTTDGPYDTVRVNPTTGQPDKSVAIKYRMRFKTSLNPSGSVIQRGIAYATSAVFETGALSTHWRMSQSIDKVAGNQIEVWDSKFPSKTGIQNSHLANGSVTGLKIMPESIMDYHVNKYAKIQEFKLQLNYPTHQHGHYTGNSMFPSNFVSNLNFLDELYGWAGTSGNFGTGNTVSRGDHLHDDRYVQLSGGSNPTLASLIVSGNLTVSGNINGENIVKMDTDLYNHIGSGGSAHAAVTTSSNGFMISTDKSKLDGIQSNAINQTTADGRYLQLAGGTLSGTLTSNSPIEISTLNPFMVTSYTSSNGSANFVADWASSNFWGIGPKTGINDNTILLGQVSANTGNWISTQPSNMNLYVGTNIVWHSGNMGEGSGLDSDKLDGHEATYFASASSVYTTGQSDGKYVQLSGNNTLSGSYTYNASGSSIIIQPTVSVSSGNNLFLLNSNTGSNLITMDGAGNMVVNGNLTVKGTTTYSQTSTSSGNSTINGDLTVSGNTTLGTAGNGNHTTVNGDMYITGNLKQSGKYIEVARTPIFGVGGDDMFYTDTISGNDVIIGHYNTFTADGTQWMPSPQTGASRYFKVLTMYSTAGSGSSANLTIFEDGTQTQVENIALANVWGVVDGSYSRSHLSSAFQTSYTGHTTWNLTNLTAQNIVIKYIELIAYDYYA